MHTKVGATPAYVLSQLTTAVVGAVCLLATTFAITGIIDNAKTALFEPVLSISPAQFSWVNKVSFGVNHVSVGPTAAQTPNIDTLVVTHLDEGLKKISHLEHRARLERAHAFAHVIHLADASRARHREFHAQHVAQRDRVRLSQAAPARATLPVLSEAEKLQRVHLALMAQFKLALNDLPGAPMATQIAKASSTHVTSGSDLGLDGVPEAPHPPRGPKHHAAIIAAKFKPQRKQEAENKFIHEPATEAPKPALATDSVRLSASAEKPAARYVGSDDMSPEAARIEAINQLADKLAGNIDIVPPPVSNQPVRQIPVTVNNGSQAPPAQDVSPTTEASQPAAAEQPMAHADAQPSRSETMNFMGSTLILPSGYSAAQAKNGYPRVATVAVNTHPQSANTTSASPHTGTGQTSGTDLVAQASHHYNALLKGFPSVNPSSTPVQSPRVEPADQSAQSTLVSRPHIVTTFVEAFDWTHAVQDAQAEILTRENAFEPYGQSQTGWRIAKAEDHWPTVYWNHSGEIPVLSKNSAKMLALKAATTLQSEAGIVIAKAPAGWSLEFSGRSEHALVFSRANQLLANDSVDGERYYVFLNASPGAQILYLVKSGETGAVTVPVYGGTLSYADLSQPESRTFTGKILDTSGKQIRGSAGMRVQVIGSGQTTVTNGSGHFQLENVICFGTQPLYIEAESNQGYPHRYKVIPESNPTFLASKSPQRLTLYLIPEEEVREWIGQLEGGVSTESGLIVAALPTVAAAHEDEKIFPSIRTLATDPTLAPETYTVSPAGQLMVKTPMSATNSRLVGVQVPEGPALVQLTNKDGQVLWSELLVVSARVLSVVGPY